ILNSAFKNQYEKLLKRISYSSLSVKDMNVADQLSLIYCLVLQERIQEGMELFSLLDKKKCVAEMEIVFDYFQAYMSLFNENEDQAGTLALDVCAKYRQRQLPRRFNKLFEDIEVLLRGELDDYQREEESNGDVRGTKTVHGFGDRDREMDKLSKATPSIEWEVDSWNRTIRVSYQLVKTLTVNFYTMNTEILFSQDPFFSEKESNPAKQAAFTYIAPITALHVTLKDVEKTQRVGVQDIAIPSNLKNQNLFIQVISENSIVCRPFYDNQLLLQVKENYGQLKVLNKNTNKPVKKAYVKVYAKTDQTTEFYKDGYTDLQGKFDYLSISTDQLQRATQLAILVSTEDLGCVVKQVNKPKQ
ncbi:hypothetical protein RFI_25001, partial [Reticulomyxa filosa]